VITSGGNRNPAKLDRGAGAARRRGISPAFLSRPSVNATEPSVAAAADIAAVEGVDVLFVGPRDLSHDLGVPSQVTAPVFVDALELVRMAARKHGKACGLLVPDGVAAAAKIAEGWTFVTIGSDSSLLATAATAQLGRARGDRT
jgi:2-dehydro-3-deoxyglucarate aldolase/4-hydroxy-2-oxoheptanedioate aldolase